ncbi:MAG: KEOPS complex subunit Pcc1 [Sulfolobales archaeon]
MIKQIRSFIYIYSASNEILNALYNSLLPETIEPPNPQRTQTKIYSKEDARVVILEISSKDLSSHRAALNTYLYILNSIIKTLEVITRSGRSD